MVGKILSGPERRRRWGTEEKARIVADVRLPGAQVTEIARRHGISRSLVYTWRREAGQGTGSDGIASTLPDLVPVVIADAGEVPKRSAVSVERLNGGAKQTGTIEIVFSTRYRRLMTATSRRSTLPASASMPFHGAAARFLKT